MKQDNVSKSSAFSFIFGFVRPYLLGYIPGAILYSAQGFLFPLTMAYFSSRVTEEMLNKSLSGIAYAGVTVVLLIVVLLIVLGAGTLLYCSGLAKADRDLKTRIFRAFVRKSLESQAASHSGEGIAAINTDADTASHLYSNALTALISCVISVVFSALVVFLVDYRMGLLALVIGLLSLAVQNGFAKPLGKTGKERLESNAESVKKLSNIFSAGLMLRAFSLQDRMLISFDKENEKLLKLSYKQAFIAMWQDFFTTIQGLLTISGVFAVGGVLVAMGQLSLPKLMMIPAMCSALATGMSTIGGAWAGMQAPLEAGKRIFELAKGGTLDSPKASAAQAQPPWNGEYTLAIENATFHYENSAAPALKNISLTIKENEMVAFVGESGSGKSTLLRAIVGLYERDNLNIRLGNMTFTNADRLSWRKRFAYVDQSCKLFDMSIAQNIAMGKENAQMEEVVAAAKEAHADTFIRALENGYDTMAGEKGASLSGGQRQRIALARALVRHAPVLIFDEATSALDVESERQVMAAVRHLRSKHTILMATHNLSSIADADQIVVMDRGEIAEVGTHEALLMKGGVYARLLRQVKETPEG